MEIRLRATRGLTIQASDSADDEVFPAFYAGYDRAFTLPEEKETRTGFEVCLGLNHGQRSAEISASLGAFREVVLVGRLDDEVVGGANVFVTPQTTHRVVTAALNYVYVLPGFRGRGLLRGIVQACCELGETLFPGIGPIVLFVELNDPLLLTEAEYEQDSAAAGVDQFDRVAIWARLGVRILDFPYVQPSLSPDQPADERLVLGVLAEPSFTLTGALLADHLERFFAISVRKTGEIAPDDLAAAQIRDARSRDLVPLLDPTHALPTLRTRIGKSDIGFRDQLAELLRRP